MDGDRVFLDLARDRYLAMGDTDRAAFERLRRGEPNDSEAMTRLMQTGLITRTPVPCPIEPTRVDIPDHDLSAQQGERFKWIMSLTAARALRWARRAMRPDQIAATVAELGRLKTRFAAPRSNGEMARIASSYAACRWINPTPPRCLVDALALDHILLTRGHAPTLVFGVRLRPFAAHCWLQTPELILTGTAAEARGFTAILTV